MKRESSLPPFTQATHLGKILEFIYCVFLAFFTVQRPRVIISNLLTKQLSVSTSNSLKNIVIHVTT